MSKFFLYVGCLQALFATLALAESGKAQVLEQTYVSYDWQNRKLEKAFADIQNQTDFFFTFDRRHIKGISISGFQKRTNLADLLKYISSRTGLRFNISKDIILVKYDVNPNETNWTDTNAYFSIELPAQYAPQLLETAAHTQVIYEVSIHKINEDQILRGKVSSADGEPLVGATIVVKETGQGTVTDEQGNFSINVPEESSFTLIASYIGYQSKELVVKGNAPIEIVLALASAELDEIVVIGYGVQKKSDLTGSVTSLPKQRLEMVPNLNIAQVLQGAVPGVFIQQTEAGAAANESILIRGRNSILADNSPLIVLDGIPYRGELRDINVSDIASIEVLKDASAAAIYGSRGSNGVILITTKTGTTGKLSINFDTRFSLQDAINVPHFMNGQEFYDFKETREPGVLTASEKAIFNNNQAVDWADLALRQGFSQQYNLSVSGGMKNVNYLIGGNYLNVKGVSLSDDYQRITSRINVDASIFDWLTIGTRTQLSYDDKSGTALNFENVFRTNPLTTPYDAQGNLTLYPWPEFTDIANPLEPINYDNSDESYQVITNNFLMVDFPFIKGLSYRLNTGVRRRVTDIATYIGRNTKVGLEAGGIAQTERTIQESTILENILSYNKTLGDHHIFATAVYSYEKNEITSNALEASRFPNDFLSFYAAAQAELVKPSFAFTDNTLLSQMLRLNYTYQGKYLLTLTGRRDGFSGFGSDNKYGVFPSVAVGWNINKENFFPVNSLISYLKLRASLGRNGNQAVSAYESISRLREENNVSLNNSLPGFVPSKLGDENLGWETTQTLNIGLDFGLLQDRFTGEINFFNSQTEDLLLNRSISAVHGIGSITQNIGKTENTGIELAIVSGNVTTKNFSWTTSANLAYVKNKIVALYGQLDANGEEIDDLANAWFIGQPIRVNYDFKFDGVWQENEADQAAIFNRKPGFAKIKDANNDGKITAEDREIIGQLDPKLTWGMSNIFSYKGLSLEFFIFGVHGITKENRLLQDASASSEVRRNVLLKNWWTPENPTNEYFKNDINAGGVALYEDASFIRIRDISLSYNLPSTLLNRLRLNQLRLYTTGRNLFTFTKWTASDPELNFGRGAIPLQRELVMGLQVGF